MSVLLLLTALLAGSPALAAGAEDGALERLRSDDSSARARACAELARAPARGARVYPALSLAMDRDASERVRLAAAEAVLTFPGGEPLARAQQFLSSEPGEQTRADMVAALAAEPSRKDDPGVTDILARTLSEDPVAAVRRAAAVGLARREDSRGLGAARRAAENDPDKSVRLAAREALRVLSAPRRQWKPAPTKIEPKPDAVKGKDACPAPWGWCECDGPITRPPKCLSHADCRIELDTVIQLGMPCEWNGASIGAPGD